MFIQHNNLRLFRKRSPLIQSDISFIMKLVDPANISRWETGLKKPNLEVLMVYHILFDTSIDSLFERQKHALEQSMAQRIGLLVQELKVLEPESHLTDRIAFLDAVLRRLLAALTL